MKKLRHCHPMYTRTVTSPTSVSVVIINAYQKARSRRCTDHFSNIVADREFRLVVTHLSFQFRSAFRAASASVTDTSVTDTFLNSSRVFTVVGCKHVHFTNSTVSNGNGERGHVTVSAQPQCRHATADNYTQTDRQTCQCQRRTETAPAISSEHRGVVGRTSTCH